MNYKEENSKKYNDEDLKDHRALAFVIKNSEGKVLMQKHIKYGFWTIPVEKVKDDEIIEEALIEGARDECNITPTKYKQTARANFVYIRNGKKVKLDWYLFEIEKYTGEIKNNEPHKHEIQEFITINEIKKFSHLSDSTIEYLKKLGIRRNAKI